MPRIMFTGHRPDKLDGWDVFEGPRTSWITRETLRVLEKLQVRYNYDVQANDGGACGFDMIAAAVCRIIGLPYDLYAPCHNQDSRWTTPYRREYQTLLEGAEAVHYTYDGNYPGAWVMQKRNIEMADACDIAVACYDGSTSGGTYNAVEYLDSLQRPIVFIDPAGTQTTIRRASLLP